MSIKATVLRESRHGEFLQVQHRDPVTHKVFAAGDRVTRCASCLLPFLDHSWQAIGLTHCGQFASVALDNCEPPVTESGPIAVTPEAEKSRAKAGRVGLAPIPIELRETPNTLR